MRLVSAYWILTLLYLGLIIYYVWMQQKENFIQAWPLLSPPPLAEEQNKTCQVDKDCPAHHVCLGFRCVPKLLRGEDCNSETGGRWISYLYRKTNFAICACSKPDIFTQKLFGGNCDVNIACGSHGIYDMRKRTCACDPGFKPSSSGLDCEKLPVLEHMKMRPCDDTSELKVSERPDLFHPDYLQKLISDDVKCVKKPCNFDALTGKPITNAIYKSGWGCICDPRYGLFGVKIDNEQKYTRDEGFDGCVGIFSREPATPSTHVDFYTYFYLEKRDPISFMVFHGLDPATVIAPLKERVSQSGGKLVMGQKKWSRDYAQYFFHRRRSVTVRKRQCYAHPAFPWYESCNEFVYKDKYIARNCKDTQKERKLFSFNTHAAAYTDLYAHPVCHIQDREENVDPKYWDTFVSNPIHLTYDPHPNLFRSNGFVLQYDVTHSKWIVDYAPPYNFDLYKAIETNVPNFEHIYEKKEYDVRFFNQ